MAAPVVIGAHYCNPYVTDIGVVLSVLPTTGHKFVVTDINNNIIFRVNGTSTSCHKQRVLVDVYGNPLVTFRMKLRSFHKRWEAFRGNSIEKKDLIFSAKRSTLMPNSDVDLNVYLAANKNEKNYDYRVDSSFTFYTAESRIIAQAMDHVVKVYQNVDVAFIASLIVIWDGMRAQEADNRERVGFVFRAGGLIN